MTAFTDKVRATVRQRSNGRCELCGVRLQVAHFHHRRPRGMGGTKSLDSGAPSNCLAVHPACHADIESSRERSLRNGWLVSQWQSPAEVPVKSYLGLVLLLDDGTVVDALGKRSVSGDV